MQLKEKNNFPALSSSNSHERIVSDEVFPKAICLECCDLTVKKGFEKEVFKTLKAFSNKELFNKRRPHNVTQMKSCIEEEFSKMKQLNASHIMSLDVGDKTKGQRLLYCKPKDSNVVKILSLCTKDTHQK